MQHFNFLYKDSLFSIALFTFIIALVILLEQARAYFTQKKTKNFYKNSPKIKTLMRAVRIWTSF
ncbi:hypothetical protein HPCPY1124_0818 [Helicobacter pylori CPY1124]|nr:hypothetical protein HPCPY1124_0818 [Helicobacter pylori CPY1124]